MFHTLRVTVLFPPPALKLNGQDLAMKNEHKFLGAVFVRKLTFLSYVEDLKTKCIKSLTLLRVQPQKLWGADCETLCRAFVSSEI